ncbi:hypothetical protein [Paenibacillus tyrfis]|uniref:hypothetical protein n=1 Tax=Paenibacillus tyrfis TaxID=1501230 RepID=UPI0020A1B829|nr:hypothetical protein [Paenibacillus tyrfis]MCP1306775.1 hypothetical protein [Paenibacillus tyrfis]
MKNHRIRLRHTVGGLVAGILLALASGAPAQAEEPSVPLQLPSFPVQVNGLKIDNERSPYPALMYKNMVYLPAKHFEDTLGLKVAWDAARGLKISRRERPSGIRPTAESKDKAFVSRRYEAILPGFPIEVNGKSINNAGEPYPLLLVDNVSYLPMTWRFTHNEFGWRTDWSAQEGFQLITEQQKVLHRIIAEDTEALYVEAESNRMLKVNKDLKGDPSPIDDKAKAGINQLAEKRKPGVPFAGEPDRTAVRLGDSVYYDNIELMSLKPILEKAAAFYASQTEYENKGLDVQSKIMKLDDRTVLAVISISSFLHIPAPYTPYTHEAFILRDGKASSVPDLTQVPTRVVRNPNGSFWIASEAADRMTSRTPNVYGQLALLDVSGQLHGMNTKLGEKDIDLLASTNDGLTVKAYSDRFKAYHDSFIPLDAEERETYYHLDLQGKETRLFLYKGAGRGYVDSKGHIYVVDRQVNRISDLTSGQSRMWWDYELKR